MTRLRPPALARALPLLLLLASGCKDEPPVNPKDQAEGLYLQAHAQYLQGRFDEALLSFAQVRKLSPTDPRLPAAVGEVYLSMGKLEEASQEFDAALKLDDKRSTVWGRLGFIHAQLGKTDQALVELGKAVALNPRDFNALEQLADLRLAARDVDEAVRLFARASEVAPDALRPGLLQRAVDVLIAEKRPAELLALLQKATSQGLRAPETLTSLGDAQVRAGLFAEAIASYSEAADKSPKDPTLWELVAELHLKQGQKDEAQAAYLKSLKVKERALIHVALARLHLERQQRADAERELAAALESVSGADVRELTELSSLLATLGRKPDALKILASLAAEPEQARDVDLQRRTARLAAELKDDAQVKAACERVAAAALPKPGDKPGQKPAAARPCP